MGQLKYCFNMTTVHNWFLINYSLKVSVSSLRVQLLHQRQWLFHVIVSN